MLKLLTILFVLFTRSFFPRFVNPFMTGSPSLYFYNFPNNRMSAGRLFGMALPGQILKGRVCWFLVRSWPEDRGISRLPGGWWVGPEPRFHQKTQRMHPVPFIHDLFWLRTIAQASGSAREQTPHRHSTRTSDTFSKKMQFPPIVILTFLSRLVTMTIRRDYLW